MGIGDSAILTVGNAIHSTTVNLVKSLVDEDSELISLYYGEEVNEDDANKVAEAIMSLYPDVDVEVHSGGQPIYYYVLSVE